MIFTTLNKIRVHSPRADGWRKLLKRLGKIEADDEPLAYSTILDAVGLDDALWCLRAEPQHESIWRMFAVRRARSMQHLMTDGRSLQVLDVAERHARGLATDAELATARAAARAAARDARVAAVDAGEAARVAWDATRTVWDAARDAWDTSRTVWVAAGEAGEAARVARDAAWTAWAARAAWDAAWDDAWDAAAEVAAEAGEAARDEQTADFLRLLAAHHAMPGESCELVDWWQGEQSMTGRDL